MGPANANIIKRKKATSWTGGQPHPPGHSQWATYRSRRGRAAHVRGAPTVYTPAGGEHPAGGPTALLLQKATSPRAANSQPTRQQEEQMRQMRGQSSMFAQRNTMESQVGAPRWPAGETAFQCRVRTWLAAEPVRHSRRSHTLQREKAHACRSKDPAQSEKSKRKSKRAAPCFPTKRRYSLGERSEAETGNLPQKEFEVMITKTIKELRKRREKQREQLRHF